ncbi:MAG: sodium/solute symporter [Gammaproteobacteria bacterium]|nr:sodium/solute symporter [Gammaproteobacteria bacterium]MYF67539.1 sodium/solute symporter [Gammaproteobacteria bacterium]MYK37356.1 sodium/solute symporter [Gammaproteobacteria bacterium]
MPEFGMLNWTILIVYVLANLLLGFILSKRVATAEDFYLGRRTTPWWAIGISVVATYVSALSFLGAPAWSYTDGMSVAMIHMNYPLVIIIVITLFLPFFYNSGCASIYEYQESRFGSKSRSTISGIFLVSHGIGAAAILYATSLVLQFITGIDVIYAIVIVTVIALIYTTLGGITAVIWTDVIQAVILFVGAGIIFYALVQQMPGSLNDTLVALKAQGMTNPLHFDFDLSHTTTVWAGVVAMTIYHVTVYGVNQMMAQRALAAKNIGDAKKSYLMMGFASPFIYFSFVFLGILFYAYYDGREFENGNTIILQFASEYGLPGLMGIIAAAVMAASMSTLDSSFNSMSTVTTVDFYQKYFRKDESEVHYLKATRWFTLMWAIIIIVPAVLFSRTEGSILEVLSQVGSYFVGAKLAMYGMGFFSKHTTERGLLVGVVASFIAVWTIAGTTDIAWPWYCLIGAAANIAVSWTASLILDGRQEEWHPFSVPGQLKKFRDQNLKEKNDGWYVVPGRIDTMSYVLFGFFVLWMIGLYFFNALI